MIGRNVLSAAVCLLICSCMAGMRMVVASRAWSGTARFGAWWKRLGQKMPQKNVLHKIISVLRSDNSSVNTVLFTADRLQQTASCGCNILS